MTCSTNRGHDSSGATKWLSGVAGAFSVGRCIDLPHLHSYEGGPFAVRICHIHAVVT
jgi:hypothetical protein